MDKDKSFAKGKTRFKRKPKKKGQSRSYEGIIKKLVDRAVREDLKQKDGKSSHQQPDYLLQKIFKECFVLPSAKLGIINLENLSVAVMEQRLKLMPPSMEKRYAPMKVLAIILASSLIGMPGGDGTLFMRDGYMDMGFMHLSR